MKLTLAQIKDMGKDELDRFGTERLGLDMSGCESWSDSVQRLMLHSREVINY